MMTRTRHHGLYCGQRPSGGKHQSCVATSLMFYGHISRRFGVLPFGRVARRCLTDSLVRDSYRSRLGLGVWGAVERKTGLGACHCKMIGIPASKAGQFMKRKKSYAKPRRASVAD